MSWQHLNDTMVKSARGKHRCSLCGEAIPIGASYIRRTGTDHGEMVVSKMHPECEKVSQGWDINEWETFEEGSMKRGADESR